MAKPSLPVIPSRALVASAVRLGKEQRKSRIYHSGQDWQRECYRHYTICGEARFAATLFSHAMSRSVLSIARETDDGQVDVEHGEADRLLKDLFHGRVGQAQMLYSLGLHLTIAGEAYLVGRKEVGKDIWEIVSVTEMDVSGRQWSINFGKDHNRIPLKDSDVVIRIWRPHPANRMEADSPFRSLLPTLNEIEWLTKHIFAQVSSRLTNDVFFLPQEMNFPPPPDVNGQPQEVENEAEAFLLVLAEAMMEALKGDGSPRDKMPIIVTAAGEDIDKARLMSFWSELDEKALQMRTEAIRRFALGMDIPPEQVLGVSGVGLGGEGGGANHWQGWQVEESTIKLHIEPMLDLISNALTLFYIRPQLEEGSSEYVTYSTISLRLRPDRSREAFELYDRGELTAEAMRRENGFEETDAPDKSDRRSWLLQKIASGSATPEMVNAALKVMGVDLGIKDNEEETRESRPTPSLEEHPSEPRTPDQPNGKPQAAALTSVCDTLVLNALDRAGRKLLNARTRSTGGPAVKSNIPFTSAHLTYKVNGQADDLLKGAFGFAPIVLEPLCDVDSTIQALHSYCSELLSTGTEHRAQGLVKHLEKAGLL